MEINPRYATAYFKRGATYDAKGQYDQVMSDYNKALDINPRYALALDKRTRACYFEEEYDKFWEDINKAQELGYQISGDFIDVLLKASGRNK